MIGWGIGLLNSKTFLDSFEFFPPLFEAVFETVLQTVVENSSNAMNTNG